MKDWKNDVLKLLGVCSLLGAYIILTMTMRYSWSTVYQSLAVLGVPAIGIVWYGSVKHALHIDSFFIRGMRVLVYIAYAWACWMLQNIYGVGNGELWLSISWLLPALYLYVVTKRAEWYVIGGSSLLIFLLNINTTTWFTVSSGWQSIMITVAALLWYRLGTNIWGRYLFFIVSLFELWLVYLTHIYEHGEPRFFVQVICIIVVTAIYVMVFKTIEERNLYKVTAGGVLTVWSLYALVDVTNLFANLTMSVAYILMGVVTLFVLLLNQILVWREKKEERNEQRYKLGEYILYGLISAIGSLLFLASLYFILWEELQERNLIMIIGASISVLAIFGYKRLTAKFLRVFLFVFGVMAGISTLFSDHHYVWGIIYGLIIFAYWIFATNKIEKHSLWWLLEGILIAEFMKHVDETEGMGYLVLIHLLFFLYATWKKQRFLLRYSFSFGMIYLFFYLLSHYQTEGSTFILSLHGGYTLLLVFIMLYIKDEMIKRIGIGIYVFSNVMMYQSEYIGNYELSWLLLIAGILLLQTRQNEQYVITYAKRMKKQHVWLIGMLTAGILISTVAYEEWNYDNGNTVLLELGHTIEKSDYKRDVWISYKLEEEVFTTMRTHELSKENKAVVYIKLKEENGTYHAEEIKYNEYPKEEGIWIKGYTSYGYITIGGTRKVPLELVTGKGMYAKVHIGKDGSSRVLRIQ
ncbi:hypothetical protein BAMA_20755 [Bacillus manliponensis]|uniref:DUF2157 domain-containing protein n=1 Tax=Bacillus manliponensis TaxID=574376 RepID=A0A073JZJ7_9BACI|nr:hypothetical protein [Bacillus manliponensis]KEK19680.1 hypothetical protein BAMA_20755 [Bacillus manliponensis]